MLYLSGDDFSDYVLFCLRSFCLRELIALCAQPEIVMLTSLGRIYKLTRADGIMVSWESCGQVACGQV